MLKQMREDRNQSKVQVDIESRPANNANVLRTMYKDRKRGKQRYRSCDQSATNQVVLRKQLLKQMLEGRDQSEVRVDIESRLANDTDLLEA